MSYEIEKLELEILKAQNADLKEKLDLQEDAENRFYENLSKRTETAVKKDTSLKNVSRKAYLGALDETFGQSTALIKPSHYYLEYSLIKNREIDNSFGKSSSGPMDSILRHSEMRNHEIIKDYTSDNTKRAFECDIFYWQAWLSAIGFNFQEPISEEIIKHFIIQHIEGLESSIDHHLVNQGYKYKLGSHSLETVKRRLASLSICLELHKYPNPVRNKEIRILLGRLAKKHGGYRSKKAITRDILDDLLDACDKSLIGIRDKAILLFGWASGGRRRSEIISAKVENLTETPLGDFIFKLEKSKSDQEGKGKEFPIKGRAAKALKDWFSASGIKEGPLFRSISKGGTIRGALSGIDINRIVKRRAKLAGYDESQYGAHSLRSGFMTEGGRQGKPLFELMEMSGHKSVNSAKGYFQSGNVINNSAANLAD